MGNELTEREIGEWFCEQCGDYILKPDQDGYCPNCANTGEVYTKFKACWHQAQVNGIPFLALNKLVNVLSEVNENWQPDYNSRGLKYIIDVNGNGELMPGTTVSYPRLMVFETAIKRDEFIKENQGLIKQAIPILVGHLKEK